MFLSVGFWLLDLPHLVVSSIMRCWHRHSERPYVDSYAFDLGYHMSYSLTVLQIGLLYSNIVPIIPAFCMIFFSFKYYVDKYNLSFVYNSEFLGVGQVKRWILPLIVLDMIIFQIITIGYFKGNFKAENLDIYLTVGFCFILFEILVILAYKLKAYRSRKQKYRAKVDEIKTYLE